MRITANQVTLARLVLLPLPVMLIYQGRSWWLWALVAYVLLGFTDAIDGMLARRYGGTALGALLDPVADKIFIAAAWGPLADFQVVPLLALVLLFIRELGVTALRSIAIEEKLSFHTSRIAKLKTAVQMGGAGFVLLYWTVTPPRLIFPVLFLGVAVAASFVIANLVRGRRPGWERSWALALLVALLVDRVLLSPSFAILVISAVVVAFTLYSGAEYAWGMRSVLLARFRRAPIEGARLALLSLAVPLAFLPALAWADAPSFTVLMVLAAELAVGGLDNSLAQMGSFRGARTDLLRAGAQGLLGALLLCALSADAEATIVHGLGLTAVLLTLGDLVARFLAHARSFRAVA